MPRETDNHNFGHGGGEPDPLGGLLADIRPPVEPMSAERTQQVFRDALRQSGVRPKTPARYGMRLWFAVSLPAGALAGAAMLAILTHKSADTPVQVKVPDKIVHTDGSHSDKDLRHNNNEKALNTPSVVKGPRMVRKGPAVPTVKHPNRKRTVQSIPSRPAPALATVEFVRNDVLLSNISAEPTAEAFYTLRDGQPVRSDTALLRYDTQDNSTRVQPVRFVVHVSQGNERGFARASTAILDDAGQMQRKYCTVKGDSESQNVIATTMIGDRSSGDGRLALTVSFTLDRPGKGETKQ